MEGSTDLKVISASQFTPPTGAGDGVPEERHNGYLQIPKNPTIKRTTLTPSSDTLTTDFKNTSSETVLTLKIPTLANLNKPSESSA
ncbi:hypothetical protein BsWGS_06189 [Bradybaena similaris]